MTRSVPKPTPPSKRKASDNPRARAYKDWLAQRGCIVPGCDRPPTLHHVAGARSRKTGHVLRRRQSVADACMIPVCKHHHQDARTSIHAIGEDAFAVEHLGGARACLEWAMTYLAAYVTEGRA